MDERDYEIVTVTYRTDQSFTVEAVWPDDEIVNDPALPRPGPTEPGEAGE